MAYKQTFYYFKNPQDLIKFDRLRRQKSCLLWTGEQLVLRLEFRGLESNTTTHIVEDLYMNLKSDFDSCDEF